MPFTLQRLGYGLMSAGGDPNGAAGIRDINNREYEAAQDELNYRRDSASKAADATRNTIMQLYIESVKSGADPEIQRKLLQAGGIEDQTGGIGGLSSHLANKAKSDAQIAKVNEAIKALGDNADPSSVREALLSGDPSKISVRAAPPKYQSKAGQTVADRSAIIEQFGDGSPELQAFDQAAGRNKSDIRTVGGALVKVGDDGSVTPLYEPSKKAPPGTQLAKAETEYEQAKAAAEADPNNQGLQDKLARAESYLDKVSGTKKEVDQKGQFETARVSLSTAREILNAGDTIGSVAGLPGAIKSKLGGLARQVGIPVSTNSKSLQKALEVVSAVIGPPLLKDSRLSNEERARIATIVGSLDGLTDEVDIANNLNELDGILTQLEGRPPAGSEKPVSEMTDEELQAEYSKRTGRN